MSNVRKVIKQINPENNVGIESCLSVFEKKTSSVAFKSGWKIK